MRHFTKEWPINRTYTLNIFSYGRLDILENVTINCLPNKCGLGHFRAAHDPKNSQKMTQKEAFFEKLT